MSFKIIWTYCWRHNPTEIQNHGAINLYTGIMHTYRVKRRPLKQLSQYRTRNNCLTSILQPDHTHFEIDIAWEAHWSKNKRAFLFWEDVFSIWWKFVVFQNWYLITKKHFPSLMLDFHPSKSNFGMSTSSALSKHWRHH